MINLIENNPFRVLGVWSNAKQAEIVRNIRKMKAFLSVGKAVEFPSDMQVLFSELDRTLEKIQISQDAIVLPKDKILHALFWFSDADPIASSSLNNLMTGNTDMVSYSYQRAKRVVKSSKQSLLSFKGDKTCVKRRIKESVDPKTGITIPEHYALCFFTAKLDASGNKIRGANGGYIAVPNSVTIVNFSPSVDQDTPLKDIVAQAHEIRVVQLANGDYFLHRPSNYELKDDNNAKSLEENYTFAVLVNYAVLSLIKSDFSSAIEAYTTLIHDPTFRSQFYTSVCGETFEMPEDDLSHLFFDILSTEIGAETLLEYAIDDKDKSYLQTKACEEPISLINREIEKATNASTTNAEEALQAGRILIKNTRSALARLCCIVGAENYQYQSTADNLAKQILQCGIIYYNHSQSDDSIINALEIQNYALSIACGKLTKDRCQQNVDILNKRKKQTFCENDIKAITEELESFQVARPKMKRVHHFLENCKPHFEVIKNYLGVTDEYYLQLSSSVANSALNMIIDIVNHNMSSKSKSKAAKEFISKISSMDLDDQTRKRVKQNASIIDSNITLMPSGFKKVDRATGGCISGILELIGGIIITGLFWGLIVYLFC